MRSTCAYIWTKWITIRLPYFMIICGWFPKLSEVSGLHMAAEFWGCSQLILTSPLI